MLPPTSMCTGAVYLEGVATTGIPSPPPASLLMCATLDMAYPGVSLITSYHYHSTEKTELSCEMLLG